MDELRGKLLEYNTNHGKHITPKELRSMYRHIANEALEYYLSENVDDKYIESLLNDVREKRT